MNVALSHATGLGLMPSVFGGDAGCFHRTHCLLRALSKSKKRRSSESHVGKTEGNQQRSKKIRSKNTANDTKPVVTQKDVEERDTRAAVRLVLSRHYMQTMMERKRMQWEVEERRQDERLALEHLERELKRHEALLKRKGSAEGANSPPADGADPSPSAVVAAYMSTIRAGGEMERSLSLLPSLSLQEVQRLHHHIRMRKRQAEKERNAQQLSGPSGTSGVDGVIPLSVTAQNKQASKAGTPGWRKFNAVSMLDGGKPLEEEETNSQPTLSLEPNLSVYSPEGDIRISSESVLLRQQQELERLASKGASPSAINEESSRGPAGSSADSLSSRRGKESDGFLDDTDGDFSPSCTKKVHSSLGIDEDL